MVDSTAGRDGSPDAGGPSPLEPALLELEGITKRFPGVLALDTVPFDLRAGEVHVLFGENGAGKSTLISIVAGVVRPESGTVKLRGEPIELGSVHHARSLGISAVFQEFSLVPQLTVEQNLFLGAEMSHGGLLSKRELRTGAEEILGRRYTGNTITDQERLIAELREIREKGYATDNQEFMSGVVCIAVPVMGPDHRLCAGIALSAPQARLTLGQACEYIPLLREAADRLSETFADDA